jgi:hypothetical protein
MRNMRRWFALCAYAEHRPVVQTRVRA